MRNGTLSITEYSRGIVRIIGKKLKFNWVNPSQKEGEKSIGSGFFIDTDGHVLTAAHVVSECLEVMIKIPNLGKDEFPVRVLGVCFDLDIALLKADPNTIPGNFHSFPIGESDLIQVGDRAHAVGFPLNQEQLSVTDGIISSRQSGGNFQTNADLNPGNSGGPLFKDGKVIGINVAIMRGSNGIGYSVPIEMYKLVEEELKGNNSQKGGGPSKETNLVRRPNLDSIGFNATNSALNKLKGSQCHESGIYAMLVSPNSPFDKIGVKPGNIICSINNKKIDYHGMIPSDYNQDEKVQVHEVFTKVKNNTEVPITFWDGSNMITKQMVAEPFDNKIRRKYPVYEQIDHEIFGGLVIMDLALNHLEIHPEYTQRLFKFTERKNRYHPQIVITDIYPTSEFARLETFSKGDIIKKVNNIDVSTLEEFRSAMAQPIYQNGTYYISIEDDMGCLGVMTTKDVLKQEEKLSEQYSYQSIIYHQLAKTSKYHENPLSNDSQNIKLSQGDNKMVLVVPQTGAGYDPLFPPNYKKSNFLC